MSKLVVVGVLISAAFVYELLNIWQSADWIDFLTLASGLSVGSVIYIMKRDSIQKLFQGKSA